MPTDWLQHIAAHVADTPGKAIPPEARTAAHTFVLDTLGVAVAGSAEPWARQLARTAPAWGQGREARLWVYGTRVPAPTAALVNAYFIHCLEYDCVHEAAVVHPMATVLAAALAQVERMGRTPGSALLEAVVLGVDVATTLGAAANAPIRFFRPATAGAFGATAAVARLAGMDAHGVARALGAVYGQISGTLQPHSEGSPLLAMQMGFNARAALTAVDLALAGLEAPRDVLTGRYGYYPLYEGSPPDEAVLGGLGSTWQVTRLSHKPYPAGRLTHGAVDGLLQLRAAHGFMAADVAAVSVQLPPLAHRLVARPDVPDPTPAYARLCLPYVAATALLHGTVDVPHYAPAALQDPAVHELAARVTAEETPNDDPAAIVPQGVRVTLRGGRELAVDLPQILGHPDAPLSTEQHLDKFRRNWGHAAHPLPVEKGGALMAAADGLERMGDARELVTLVVR